MIELHNITRTYKTGSTIQNALKDISVSFRDTEFVAILGSSGSGKTTLLNIVGGLDRATSGNLIINGVGTQSYKAKDWDTYRNHHIGFIFQNYNLIAHQSIQSNVEMGLILSGMSKQKRTQRALECLEEVGLKEHASKKPAQLSGGQAQRVAIARALATNPDIILADEPTGALDSVTGIQIMDLLKQASKNRLIIMVTHNAELAQQFATRIIELKDGQIISDSNPVALPTVKTVETKVVVGGPNIPQTNVQRIAKTASASPISASNPTPKSPDAKTNPKGVKKHASMSFGTALQLSFSNLMTKKSRTFLTAFAASIGIFGIGCILAITNGVNNYIAKTEQDTIAAMPLTIEQRAYNMEALMRPDKVMPDAKTTLETTQEGEIPQANTLEEMIASEDVSVKKNNLAPFMAYIKSGGGNIQSYARSILYNYDIQPVFLQKDSAIEIVGKDLTSLLKNKNDHDEITFGTNGFSPQKEELDVLKSQYSLEAGKWPETDHEALLLLNKDHTIDNYTLFGIGYLSEKNLNNYASKLTDEDVKRSDVETPYKPFTFDDALKLTYTLVPRADFYVEDDENMWVPSNSKKQLEHAFENGETIEVVGVIAPNETTSEGEGNPMQGAVLSPGVVYSARLNTLLIEKAKKTPAVQAQLNNPKVDIFSGRTFKSIKNGEYDKETEPFSNFSSMPGNSGSLTSGTTKSNTQTQLNLFEMLKPSPEELQALSKEILSTIDQETLKDLVLNLPLPKLTELNSLNLDPQKVNDLTVAIADLSREFLPWYLKTYGDASKNPTLNEVYTAFMQTSHAQKIFETTKALFTSKEIAVIENWFNSYFKNELIPYIQTNWQKLSSSFGEPAIRAISKVMEQKINLVFALYMQNMMQGYMSNIMGMLSPNLGAIGSLSSLLNQSNSVNSLNLDGFDFKKLSRTFDRFYNANATGLEENLHMLGYMDLDSPSSIDIYPKSFNDKEKIKDAITEYNTTAEETGKPENVIFYNDVLALIFASIAEIINIISGVLIMFVSVSLVVSSIMIGIITYISVLERQKEIGILRALGASKTNVSNIFNAETTIEGFIAGLLAVVTIYTLTPGVNALISEFTKAQNIVDLPFYYAAGLIGNSILLTLIAGLIPSSKASRKNPVEALRSE